MSALNLNTAEPARVYHCPHCRQAVNTALQDCPFCNHALDGRFAETQANLEGKVNRALSEASYVWGIAVSGLGFLVMGIVCGGTGFFMRSGDYVWAWRSTAYALASPFIYVFGLAILSASMFLSVRWWISFGTISRTSPEFGRARRQAMRSGGIIAVAWLVALAPVAIWIFVSAR